jgi:ComF family protein
MPFLNRAPLDESGRCPLCRLGLLGFDQVYSWGSYEGPLRKLVHLFKYGGVRPLGARFGEWMAAALPADAGFDLVTPMPLHWRRYWERGFNQSETLAREVARRRGVPLRQALRRVRSTAPQAGLTNAKRRANVRGAFALARGARLDGLRVLLVDDVITTGATASACARVLKRGGARQVAVLALARTDRRIALEEFRGPLAAAAGSSR